MFSDARGVEDGAIIQGDICIVGAGAAGITTALGLLNGRRRIVLLESGDLDYEGETQALYQGANLGLPYYDLDVCRLRYFGGTTNHWEGRCRPLDPIDFEARPWVPHSGWPITKATLDPFYARAHEICQLGPYRYDPADWLQPGESALPFDPAKITTRLWQFSPPTRFGEAYRQTLATAPNVQVLLNADVVDIATNEAGSEVAQLQVATLSGRRFSVRAPTFVLACGGLENARLLLAARQRVNVGLGNQHDNVGRYFMEHPHVPAAKVVVDDPKRVQFYDPDIPAAWRAGHKIVGCLNVHREVQAKAELLNCDCNFVVDNIGTSGYAALRRIWNAAERGAMPDNLWADLGRALADIDDTAAGLLGRFGVREYLPDETRFYMWSTAEQCPDPDSRVVLGDERDALGVPRIKLDWRLNELDKRSLRTVQLKIAEEFGRTGSGRLKINQWLDDDPGVWDMMGGAHHMGTTRMSATPEHGVVDQDCRVHGIANLHIAGSSVFPTGGSANPTLTIVALALRLADHLEDRAIAQS